MTDREEVVPVVLRLKASWLTRLLTRLGIWRRELAGGVTVEVSRLGQISRTKLAAGESITVRDVAGPVSRLTLERNAIRLEFFR